MAPQTCDMSRFPASAISDPPFCLQRPWSRRLHWTASWVPRVVFIDCLAGTWTVLCCAVLCREQGFLRLLDFFSSDTRRSVACRNLGL